MKKRALIVGINYEGTGNKLRGCINDANNMQAMLTSKGFTDIKMVLEKEATTAGIIAGLEWLVKGVVPGDVIVFHYSGHGSQLPSRVEEDGWEEIICPVDLNWIDKVITDDTLRKIFDRVPHGVNTTLILDCCHSGTMLDQTESTALAAPATKDAFNFPKTTETKTKSVKKGSRYLKPPAKVLKELKNRELVEWETSRDVNSSALLIAAAHASQTAADANINGVYQGAATASILEALAYNAAPSYKLLAYSMTEYMVKNKFSQRPQLDGAGYLYENKFLEPFNLITPPAPITPPTDSLLPPIGEVKPQKSKKGLFIVVGALLVAALIIFLIG